jgi:hypothetical protein
MDEAVDKRCKSHRFLDIIRIKHYLLSCLACPALIQQSTSALLITNYCIMLFNIILYLLPIAVIAAPVQKEMAGDPETKICRMGQSPNSFATVQFVDVALVEPSGRNPEQHCFEPHRCITLQGKNFEQK